MGKESQMQIFAQAVKEGSFSSAARLLNLTPSAVSKQIGALEDRLGVRLLNRTTRQLKLTEAGARYFDHSLRILSEIEEAESEVGGMRDTPRGLLRINAPVVMGARQIAPLMTEFQTRYPDIKVEMNLSDIRVDLIENGEDVALRVGELTDSSLIARKLCPISRLVIAAPSYLEKHGQPQTPEALLDHNCTTYNQPLKLNAWEFNNCPGHKTVTVKGSFVSNNGEAHYYAALSGLGVTRLATYLVSDRLQRGELVPILTEYTPPTGAFLWAVYPPTRYVPPKVRVFIDFLLEKLTPVPPWDVHYHHGIYVND